MESLSKIYFLTEAEDIPYLNLESTGFLGYTGMRFRMSLPENDGMLFVFERSAKHGFWMKDVDIPLDIIFIDSAFKVVGIKNDASPNTTEPVYPPTSIKYCVEANAGWCEKNNIQVGTRVKFTGMF